MVRTPYGRGLVLRTRSLDKIQEIELLDWQTPGKRAPILYSATTFPSVAPMVDDDVVSLYGRGRVVKVNPNNHTCTIELTNWRLAQRSTVKCHLRQSDVCVVRKKTLYEMNAFEKVEYAQQMKQSATNCFIQKDYKSALEHYDRAITSVRFVQHDANSTNELRADLLTVMITCYNNAGTCCILLQEYEEAIKFANNAIVLIDALYEKRGLKIHTILNKEGLSNVKLFGEWRTKSLLIKARGLMERGDYNDALEVLKEAHHVIEKHMETDKLQDPIYQSSYATLYKQSKDLKRLHATCVQKRKSQKQKEKQRAQAMFASASKKTNGKTNGAANVEKTKPVSETNKSVAPVLNTANTDESLDEIPTIQTKRSVSFSDDTKPGTDEFLMEEVEEEPWYEEHKEALILTGVVGLVALTAIFFHPRN